MYLGKLYSCVLGSARQQLLGLSPPVKPSCHVHMSVPSKWHPRVTAVCGASEEEDLHTCHANEDLATVSRAKWDWAGRAWLRLPTLPQIAAI
jgi:hypothetical protein